MSDSIISAVPWWFRVLALIGLLAMISLGIACLSLAIGWVTERTGLKRRARDRRVRDEERHIVSVMLAELAEDCRADPPTRRLLQALADAVHTGKDASDLYEVWVRDRSSR